MNTCFNEIKAMPNNTVDGKVLYKIPAGAMCGNGDLGVVFYNGDNGQFLRCIHFNFPIFYEGE